MTIIRAPFTVSGRAQDDPAQELPVVARTTLDKDFAGGPLTGSSVVEMVSAAAATGPLAYVALERVDATLEGRSGTFVLQHVGSITDGVASLEIQVVAGSATDSLVGLSGHGTIVHTDAGAYFDLDYELPG